MFFRSLFCVRRFVFVMMLAGRREKKNMFFALIGYRFLCTRTEKDGVDFPADVHW